MRFEVLAAVVMNNDFWHIMQCWGEQLLALGRSTAVDINTPEELS
jgi:hypothetical protein